VQHPAGDDELADSFGKAYENRVGSKDHVFESRRWRDGFDPASSMLEGETQGLPLPLGLPVINRNLF
jgi:hypothetical protein